MTRLFYFLKVGRIPARQGLNVDYFKPICRFIKIQNRNARLSFCYFKIPYPVNFGIENDDIGTENTYFWDVYQ